VAACHLDTTNNLERRFLRHIQTTPFFLTASLSFFFCMYKDEKLRPKANIIRLSGPCVIRPFHFQVRKKIKFYLSSCVIYINSSLVFETLLPYCKRNPDILENKFKILLYGACTFRPFHFHKESNFQTPKCKPRFSIIELNQNQNQK